MVLSGSTSCYDYWEKMGKNYDNTENSHLIVCDTYIEITCQTQH